LFIEKSLVILQGAGTAASRGVNQGNYTHPPVIFATEVKVEELMGFNWVLKGFNGPSRDLLSTGI
jgi:hypothetical protein